MDELPAAFLLGGWTGSRYPFCSLNPWKNSWKIFFLPKRVFCLENKQGYLTALLILLLNNAWKREDMYHLEYGLVICTKGPHKGKTGYLDDVNTYEGKQCGIVYFGNPSFCSSYHLAPIEYLSNKVTMYEIIQRKEELQQ